MAAGRAETFDQRAEIFGSLVLRNRMVAGLRLVVPAIGVVAFLALIGQMYVASLARQYGVAGIRIDRGMMVVEAPQYSGTGSGGSRYLATAREARTPLGGGSEIDMTDATLHYVRPDGSSYFATARTAHMNTDAETIFAPGVVDVTGSDGLVGTLTDVDADTDADITISRGPVDLLLSDGTIIIGSTMVRDGKAQTWTFTNASVTVKELPKAEGDMPLDPDESAPLDLRDALQ